MDSTFLIDMMFDGKPIEEFEKILRSGEVGAEWGDCYICVIVKKVMKV